MADYAAFTLTPDQARNVARLTAFLTAHLAQTVTVEFTKRSDNSHRIMSGEVVELKDNTDSSHTAVVLLTDAGYRTATLFTIITCKAGV